MMKGMFYNWVRWQCLNQREWNDGEIPIGTMIDDDEFTMQILKMFKAMYPRGKAAVCKTALVSGFDSHHGLHEELWNADPNCKHEIVNKWSGVECKKCKGWFCY